MGRQPGFGRRFTVRRYEFFSAKSCPPVALASNKDVSRAASRKRTELIRASRRLKVSVRHLHVGGRLPKTDRSRPARGRGLLRLGLFPSLHNTRPKI
jgi:hypothetical protein